MCYIWAQRRILSGVMSLHFVHDCAVYLWTVKDGSCATTSTHWNWMIACHISLASLWSILFSIPGYVDHFRKYRLKPIPNESQPAGHRQNSDLWFASACKVLLMRDIDVFQGWSPWFHENPAKMCSAKWHKSIRVWMEKSSIMIPYIVQCRWNYSAFSGGLGRIKRLSASNWGTLYTKQSNLWRWKMGFALQLIDDHRYQQEKIRSLFLIDDQYREVCQVLSG